MDDGLKDNDSEETDAMPIAGIQYDLSDEEILVDRIANTCSSRATVKTDFSACVVDVRTALNPYDVEWDYGYYASKPHYKAMTNAVYNFVGNSNVYACDNTLEQYAGRKTDTRWIHFDVFMGTLDTALHSN